MPKEIQKLRSEEVQDILTKVPHWMILWGNTMILFLLVLFFLFTWFIKYPDIISTEAIITSQSPPQREYANATGAIDTLMVKNNEYVMNGEPMAMIENTASFNDVYLLKAILDTIQIKNSGLDFPILKIPILSLGEISNTYAIFEKEYTNYQLNKRLDPFSNQIAANSLSENEIRLRLKSLETQKIIDQQKLELSENEYQRNKQLYQKGVISLNEFESKQLQFLEEKKRLNNYEITISQLKQGLNDAYKTSKETKINNQFEETRLFKSTVQSFTQLKESIKQWEDKYILKANIAGNVSFLNLYNKNQNVQKGDLLFTIIPAENHEYLATIKAPIRNSGKIRTGQKVNIKLFNYPETEYGMIDGNVESMSAIPNEDGHYLVHVSLEKTLVTTYGIEIPFINEMTGTAEIVTEDLRLMERFFYQLRGLF